MTFVPSDLATFALRPPLASRQPGLLAAILSDRPERVVDAAQAEGIAVDCADAATLWLLPHNAPRIVFLDLPVAGVSPRRLSLLLRQLCRACPDLVIAALNPLDGLPVDIVVQSPTDDSLAEAFAEARHLLCPVPRPQSVFRRQAQKRHSLFR